MTVLSPAEQFVLRILGESPASQDALRAELSGADAEFRAEVEELLSCADAPMDMLFDSSKIPGPRVPALPGLRIRAELGWGGMGLAYLAHDEELDREVVLKTVVESRWDLDAWYERFEREACITGQLQVQGVPPVFRRGKLPDPDGRPYMLMKYVQGRRLDELLDARSDAQQSLPVFIDLFAGICSTIGHAHARRILHRDIKPANIFIEGEREAIVLDWGLAKLLEHGSAAVPDVRSGLPELRAGGDDRSGYPGTQVGSKLGTVGFISPEALRGETAEVDARSDVFSLGALLALILLGRNHLKGADRIEALEDAVARTRAALEAATTEIDLHRLAADCLQLRKQDRPSDATVLAQRVRAHQLRVEEARQLAELEAARAAARVQAQRRVIRVAFFCAAIVLVAGIVALVQYFRAEEHAADMIEQRGFAQRSAEAAGQLLKELEQVSTFQESQLSGVDVGLMGTRLRRAVIHASREEQRAEVEDGLAAVNFTDLALEMLWDSVFERALEAIEKDFGGQPGLQARLLQVVAITLRELGFLKQATAPQVAALEIRRRELGNADAVTLSSVTHMGVLLQDQGKLAEAEPLYREAVEGVRSLRGEEHRDTLVAIGNMAALLRQQGRYTEAEPMTQYVLESFRRARGDEDPDTLNALSHMGMLRLVQRRLPEAAALMREAHEKRLRALGPEHPATLASLPGICRLLNDQGQPVEAEFFSREALKVFRQVLGDEHPTTVSAMNNLAVALKGQGRLAEAEPYFREAVEKSRFLLGDQHPDTLTAIHNMGYCLHHQGRPSEAEELYREALEGRRRVLVEGHTDILTAIHNLAMFYSHQKRLPEAEAQYRELLALRRRVRGEYHEETLMALYRLGRLLVDQGKLTEALPLLTEELEKSRRLYGDDHSDTHVSIFAMAKLLVKMGRHSDARDLLEPLEPAARKYRDETGKADMLAVVLRQLGYACMGIPSPESRLRAETLLVEAHATWKSMVGVAPEDSAECARALVALYTAWHQAEPGAGYDQKAAAWQAKLDASGGGIGH